MQVSRRAALAAAVATVAGCHAAASPSPPRPAPTASPDAAALGWARRREAAILAAYDARIRALPLHRRAALQVERAIHATHLSALGGGPLPRTSAAAHHGSPRAAVGGSVSRLQRFSLHASEGRTAALLASIAASHAASLR